MTRSTSMYFALPREVIEHALAHKLNDQAEAAYQRGTVLRKRAALMEQWATFCNERGSAAALAHRPC